MLKTLKPCGTVAAYQRHGVYGEQPCEACRRAYADYSKARRQRGPVARPTVEERFWAKVDKSTANGCWRWTAGRAGEYGAFFIAPGLKQGKAHRVSYELVKGTIPVGLEVDHLCRNTLCVNPEHLEAVTPRVNKLRGVGRPATNARKTQCLKGHPYTPENTYLSKRDGHRTCRACSRERWRRYSTRRRSVA